MKKLLFLFCLITLGVLNTQAQEVDKPEVKEANIGKVAIEAVKVTVKAIRDGAIYEGAKKVYESVKENAQKEKEYIEKYRSEQKAIEKGKPHYYDGMTPAQRRLTTKELNCKRC